MGKKTFWRRPFCGKYSTVSRWPGFRWSLFTISILFRSRSLFSRTVPCSRYSVNLVAIVLMLWGFYGCTSFLYTCMCDWMDICFFVSNNSWLYFQTSLKICTRYLVILSSFQPSQLEVGIPFRFSNIIDLYNTRYFGERIEVGTLDSI